MPQFCFFAACAVRVSRLQTMPLSFRYDRLRIVVVACAFRPSACLRSDYVRAVRDAFPRRY